MKFASNKALKTGLIFAMLIYPLLVLLGLRVLGVRLMAAVLAVIVALRAWQSLHTQQYRQAWIFAGAGLLAVVAILANSQLALRFYPVVVSLGMSALFAISLGEPKTLVEKMAEASGVQMSDAARAYTRGVTLLWAAVLLINALIAAYTALFASIEFWSLYNGLLSYLLMGAVFALEYCFRIIYKKRKEHGPSID